MVGRAHISLHFAYEIQRNNCNSLREYHKVHMVSLTTTEQLDDMLRRFLVVATAAPYDALGDHVNRCITFQGTELHRTPGVTPVSGGDGPNNLYTWLPTYNVPICLIQVSKNHTVIFVCTLQKFFTSSEICSLPLDTPPGSVLAALYTEDIGETYRTPRILIYDVLYWGCNDTGDLVRDYSTAYASERYQLLREQFIPILTRANENGLQKTLVVQWLGYLSAALKLIDGSINLGHEATKLLSLHPTDARFPSAKQPVFPHHRKHAKAQKQTETRCVLRVGDFELPHCKINHL